MKDIHNNTDGSCLSGTISAKQSKRFSALYGKIHTLQHFFSIKTFVYVFQLKFHRSLLSDVYDSLSLHAAEHLLVLFTHPKRFRHFLYTFIIREVVKITR